MKNYRIKSGLVVVINRTKNTKHIFPQVVRIPIYTSSKGIDKKPVTFNVKDKLKC